MNLIFSVIGLFILSWLAIFTFKRRRKVSPPAPAPAPAPATPVAPAPAAHSGQHLWSPDDLRFYAKVLFILILAAALVAFLCSQLVMHMSSPATTVSDVSSKPATDGVSIVTISFYIVLILGLAGIVRLYIKRNARTHKLRVKKVKEKVDPHEKHSKWKSLFTSLAFWEKTYETGTDKKGEKKGHLLAFPILLLILYVMLGAVLAYGKPDWFEPWLNHWPLFLIFIPIWGMLTAWVVTLGKHSLTTFALLLGLLLGIVARDKYRETVWWQVREAEQLSRVQTAEAKAERREEARLKARTFSKSYTLKPGQWSEYTLSKDWQYAFDPQDYVVWFSNVNPEERTDGPKELVTYDPGMTKVWFQPEGDEEVELIVWSTARGKK